MNDIGSQRSAYTRPKKDRLYSPDFLHRGQCDCLREVPKYPSKVRRPEPRQGSLVRTHQGIIGSANCVMKNAYRRDELAEKHNIMCLEMEATGVMAITGCLPIRGISDYADGHKNDEWQPYAALAAAVYAKELLNVIHTATVAGWELNVPGNVLETFVRAALASADAFLSADNSLYSAQCATEELLEAYDLVEELLIPELEKLEYLYCAKPILQNVEDLNFWLVKVGEGLKSLGKNIDRQSHSTADYATKTEWEELKAQVDENTSRIEALSTATQNTVDRTLPVQSMLVYDNKPMYKRDRSLFWKVRRYPQQFTRHFATLRKQFMCAITSNRRSKLDFPQSPPAHNLASREKITHPSSASTANHTPGSQLRKKLSTLGTGLLSGLCGV